MKETRAYDKLCKMFPKAHWNRIETWASIGIFDSNACMNGVEVWVECKQVKKPKGAASYLPIKVRQSQVLWEASRRAKGGKTFIAVMVDSEMFLLHGWRIKNLKEGVTYEELKLYSINPNFLFV